MTDESFVPVMRINNTTLIPIVRSLLDEAGIQYFIKNERQHDLVGYVRLTSGGYNPWWQPEVLVQSSRAEEARELLNAPLEESATAGSDGQTSYRSMHAPSALIVAGMWLAFAPTIAVTLILLVSSGTGDPVTRVLMLAFTAVLGALLWRVTGNYFAARRRSTGS